jgi:cell division transport system permease protein
MIFTTTKRIIKTGFVNFWRNGFLSFAAIIVITMSLLALGGLIFADAFGHSLLAQVKQQVDITVYFTLTAPDADIQTLRTTVARLPEVADTVYVSREQALTDFQEKWKNNNLIMQGLREVGSNPFPASLSIKAREPGQYGGIADYLEKKNPVDENGTPIIDKINYQENKLIIDRLSRIIPTVEQGGAVVAIILLIVAIIVVFNTIRLITYSVRDEISVMKLVGATNVFVRGPLVISGVMYGIISGIITLLLLAILAYWSDLIILRLAGVDVAQNFSFAVNVFSNYFRSNLGEIAGIILGAGIFLGGVSSYIAARRYLRV